MALLSSWGAAQPGSPSTSPSPAESAVPLRWTTDEADKQWVTPEADSFYFRGVTVRSSAAYAFAVDEARPTYVTGLSKDDHFWITMTVAENQNSAKSLMAAYTRQARSATRQPVRIVEWSPADPGLHAAVRCYESTLKSGDSGEAVKTLKGFGYISNDARYLFYNFSLRKPDSAVTLQSRLFPYLNTVRFGQRFPASS